MSAQPRPSGDCSLRGVSIRKSYRPQRKPIDDRDLIEAVEAVGGSALLDQAWLGPEWLPSSQEIRDPQQWIKRVQSVIHAAP